MDCAIEIAHLTIFDVAVLVALVGAGGGEDTTGEHQRIYAALSEFVGRTEPGLDTVLVWQDSEGITKFISPLQQHRFFEIMKYDQLCAQADGSVTLTSV
jgi:hypothetical protein